MQTLAEGDAGCFRLTPMGEYSRSDVPGSQRAHALLLAGPLQQRAWSRLLEIVQTGQGPSPQSLFPFLAKYPEEAAIFSEAMASRTAAAGGAVAAAYDCSRFSTIVELGGGYGSLLRTILRANPMLRGILFDLPNVTEQAKEYVRAAGLTDRCEVVGGDFFAALPGGCDAYILKSVIHDWDDAHGCGYPEQSVGRDGREWQAVAGRDGRPIPNQPVFHGAKLSSEATSTCW